MHFKVVFNLIGRLLCLTSLFLFVPICAAIIYSEDTELEHFVTTALISLLLGAILLFKFRKYGNENMGTKDGFLLVTLSWLSMSLLGCLPFYWSDYFPSFVDAFFESASGFSTTGASILTDIEVLPKSLLMWRSFTHWIGGMGIIVLAVAILPQLSVGGMQLMRNETPGPSVEQLKPRIKQTALTLWKVYLLFSVLEVLALYACDMSLFESLCHMFGTMGTGGFSTRNASIGAFSYRVQFVITFFMFIAGSSFVLHYRAIKGEPIRFVQDTEWKFFAGTIAVFIALITMDLVVQGDKHLFDAFRLSAFQVLSMASTTGYATDDFNSWPYFAKGLLFLFMIVGGCSGSTSGGMKQVRLMLLLKKARQSITQHIFPKAVVTVKMNREIVPENILQGVGNFLLIYLVIVFHCTLFILFFNIDFVTAVTAVIACLSNIGPGYGLVGAAENYAFFPAAVKYLLAACMIIGRLEIYTVLVLFFPLTWKK